MTEKTSTYSRSANQFSVSGASTFHACNCIGPQNGEPYCPCKMRGVERRGGRWVEPERDLGPIEPEAPGIWPSPSPIGCICPPTSEQTCQRPTCPRRGIKVSFSAKASPHV